MALDHRDCIRPVRALASGPEAFWTAVEDLPHSEAGTFARFATDHRLLCWLAPVLGDARARALFPAEFLALAARRLADSRRRDRGLAAATKDVATAFAAAGIDGLFLKGLLFAERFYDDPARRHQMDVDVVVPPEQIERALEALAGVGFDVATDLESGTAMGERLQRIRRPGRRRVPHAVQVGRQEAKVDLHWCLRTRGVPPHGQRELWTTAVATSVAGTPVRTLSDENALMFLLLSICSDVKRGACVAKHFLDLHLMLRAVEHSLDWEGCFDDWARQGVLRPCVNVLAVFSVVWECAGELPRLASALERRWSLVELRDEAEAVALLERPRGNDENRVWRRRVYPRSPWHRVASQLTLDLPHALSGFGRSRRLPAPSAG